MRQVIIDCLFFFSHIQLHRGRYSIGGKLVLMRIVILPQKMCEVRERCKGDEGIQGSELIIIIYHRISWVRRKKEISVGEGK